MCGKRLGVLLLFCLVASSTGCFLKDKTPIPEQDLSIGNFSATCKLDMGRFSKILDESLSTELECLKKNLNSYMDLVARQDPNHVQLKDLSRFVEKFYPREHVVANKVLPLVFQLSSVLFGDDEGLIHITNIGRMLQLLSIINQHGVLIRRELRHITKENYHEKRDKIANALANFSSSSIVILQDGHETKNQLNIIGLAENLKDIFKQDFEKFDRETLQSTLFIKKIFVGGEQEFLNLVNIRSLLKKAPPLVMAILDFWMFDLNKLLDDQTTQYRFLNAINELDRLRYPNQDSEIIVGHRDLMILLAKMLKGKYDVSKFEEGFIRFKQNIIGGDPDWYCSFDINKIIEGAREILETLYFNNATYNHFRPLLEQPGEVLSMERPVLSEYQLIPMSRVLHYWSIFQYMLTKYRFFTDASGRQIYGDHYDRHVSGVNRMAIMRIAFTRIIRAYGFSNPLQDTQGYTHLIDHKRLKNFMYQFKEIFYELNLLTADIDRIINEISMGADLFQTHSNDDFAMNEDELTEYIALILSSNKIGREITQQLTNVCQLIPGKDGGFDVPCYREYFYNIVFRELKLEWYFPKLFHYYTRSRSSETWDHLLNLEGNSRIIPDDRVPMTPTDINRLVTSFAQIESMLIRFDINHNNFLDDVEIDNGYLHFKKIIVKMANLKEPNDKILKSIFLFLLQKKKIPKKIELLTFHLFGNKKNITASRYTIGLVLASLIKK